MCKCPYLSNSLRYLSDMGAIGLQRVTDSVKAIALYKALGSSVYLKKELFNKRSGPGFILVHHSDCKEYLVWCKILKNYSIVAESLKLLMEVCASCGISNVDTLFQTTGRVYGTLQS